MRTPESVEKFLAEDELESFTGLIWMRFVASQMSPAVFDQTTIDVEAKGKDKGLYLFRATGSDAEVRQASSKSTKRARTRRTTTTMSWKSKLPRGDAGRGAEVQVHRAGTALHRAASEIYGSDPGEGTRSPMAVGEVIVRPMLRSFRPFRSASTSWKEGTASSGPTESWAWW